MKGILPRKGLWGPGAQGAVHGGAEGADSAGLSGGGPPGGRAEAGWSLHRGGPEAASLPPVAETLRPAEGGDVLGVSWGGRTGRSRQVVACVVGGRSEATGRRLWEAIPEAYRGCRSYSDFWAADGSVFPQLTHRSVDKKSGQLDHIERWRNTVRQRLARYVRKTLSFSQSVAFHEAVTRWFVTDYNLGLLSSVTS